jgi:hypothetical protein
VTDFACGSRFKGSKFKVGDNVAKLQLILGLLNLWTEPAGLSDRLVTHNLDIVSVRVEDEGAVIIRMIMGSEARRAVVFSSGREGGLMKCVDQ